MTLRARLESGRGVGGENRVDGVDGVVFESKGTLRACLESGRARDWAG